MKEQVPFFRNLRQDLCIKARNVSRGLLNQNLRASLNLLEKPEPSEQNPSVKDKTARRSE